MTDQPSDAWNSPGGQSSDPPPPPPPPPPGGAPAPPDTGWQGQPPPPGSPGWQPGPPAPPAKKSPLPLIVGLVVLLALAGGGYLYARDRSDKKADTKKEQLQKATDRAIQDVAAAQAREADVDNTDGNEPKAMRVTGGESGTSFTVDVPPGWEGRLVGKKIAASSAVEAFLNGPTSDGFTPNIVVEVTAVDIDGASAHQMLTLALDNSAQQLPGLKLVGQQKQVKVGGMDGIARDYSAPLGTAELSAQLAVAVHDDRAYFFYLSTKGSQRAQAQGLFDAFLETIEFE